MDSATTELSALFDDDDAPPLRRLRKGAAAPVSDDEDEPMIKVKGQTRGYGEDCE